MDHSSSIDIRTKRPALIVVDMQRRYAVGDMASASDILPNVNGASELFRKAGLPVVMVKMKGPGHGTPEWLADPEGFIDGLVVRDSDILVEKREMNAFCGTGLSDILRNTGSDSVVICGVVAKWCVIATYFGAFEHGFMPYLLKDGTASFDPEHVPHVEAICKTVDLDGLRQVPALRPLRRTFLFYRQKAWPAP